MSLDEWKMLAETIAEFHHVKLPDDMLQDAMNDRYMLLNAIFAFDEFKEKKTEILALLETTDFSLCLVHGDLHEKNFIYNHQDGTVILMDFETTHFGYCAYDWAKSFRNFLSRIVRLPDVESDTIVEWHDKEV